MSLRSDVTILKRDVARLRAEINSLSSDPATIIWNEFKDLPFTSDGPLVRDVGFGVREAIRKGRITRKQALEVLGLTKGNK